MNHSSYSHIWCDHCDRVQPLVAEPPSGIDVTGQFEGGDLVCAVCGETLITLFRPTTAITFAPSATQPVFLDGSFLI